MTSASELVKVLNAAAASPPEAGKEERLALIAACDKLKNSFETPMEASLRFIFSPHHSVALRLAIDVKLFDAAAELSKNNKEITLEGLSSKITTEPLFIARIMRFLAVMNIFSEVGKDTYTTTPLAAAYVSDSLYAHAIVHMTSQNEVIAQLPRYFEEKGYKNPDDAFNGPFQYARQTDKHCFEWLAAQPRLQNSFNKVMSISRTPGVQSWFEYFPVDSKLGGKSKAEPLLVDIGGGVGHDLIALREHYPTLNGTLIVQDIPVVIDSVQGLPAGIQAMAHDFFQPQPVRNAKAYYLANVLHDWPDKQALQILNHIRDAMSEDSIVLVHENVIPEVNVSAFSASTDLIMMSNFSSLERTEQQYKALLEEAGLALVKTWAPDGAVKGEGRKLVEAVLRE
ncbi:hypothetical protein AJ79_08284 [Helicocarpus griseus UAMH5409]|uniref:Uncharacterized protein n=1 Tax=Helicocarpus griseus UAMH5409 TaxID=1447875 RepID=A0A2B7WUA8_9EURO|nr:hypothetical protein AJ79_08284 [Helicocarpus griseus UAMH5409]